jgi:ribosomal protein S18 acetylase RimI-like enzyme
MSEYQFSNALGYTLEQMSEMHNASFSGYFMPAEMTPEMTADFWRSNTIDALRSMIMHDENGTFVGMARMGARGKRGWCGGFGIVPEFRGSGASRLLAEQMVRVARETGLTSLQLEVLTQNTRAFKLYERVGFVTTRRLVGLMRSTEALPDGEPALRTERVAIETLLTEFASAAQPCWGCELATILNGSSEAIVTSSPRGQFSGLIVQRNKAMNILSTFLQNELTDDELAALLRQAAGEAGTLVVYNEPEESPYLARYRALGFSEFFTQYEMSMQL